MSFIVWAKSFQDLVSLLFRRLFHGDRLEASLQSSILLYIFAVLFQSGRTYDLQFSTGKRWLQNIGSVKGSFCSASSNNCMKLINKQKNPLILTYFIHDLTDTLLKFTSVLASSHHSRQIQHYQSLVFNRLRNTTCKNPLGKPLCNSSLAYPRFSYQTWIVLGSTA